MLNTRIHCDYFEGLIEEIALEGLDGITIEALWKRLDTRPGFLLKPKDDRVKEFLWGAVSKLSNVQFYLLQEPRLPLQILDRMKNVTEQGGFLAPKEAPPDIYPHFVIEFEGVQGSCSTFFTRKNITSEVREKTLTYVLETWGNKLVIVADQLTRRNALLPPDVDPSIELLNNPYCLLERIGRSRYNGEVTTGHHALKSIWTNSKLLFYHKKILLQHKMIIKQAFYEKCGGVSRHGSILHLQRFSTVILSTKVIVAQQISEYLKKQPGHCKQLSEVQQTFKDTNFKKIIRTNPTLFKTEIVPYRQMHPNASEKEWKIKNGAEKSIRVIKLLKEISYSDEEDDEESEDVHLNWALRRLDRTLLRQVYNLVESSGPQGLLRPEIAKYFGINYLLSRTLLRHFTKTDKFGTYMRDKGRQRSTYYFCKKFEKLRLDMDIEKGKLLEIIKPSTSKNIETLDISNEEPPAKKIKRNVARLEPIVPNTPDKKPRQSKPPEIQPTKEEMDSIQTKISIFEAPSINMSFGQDLNDGYKFGAKDKNITVKIVKRLNLILRAVSTHKVILGIVKIIKLINAEEEIQGSKFGVDKKTVIRLIDKLLREGYLKKVQATLSGIGKEQVLTFICHPSVTKYHSEIQSAIEQAKMKFFILTKENIKRLKGLNMKCKYNKKMIKPNGLKPKCLRMKALHLYLFYLIYGFDGEPIDIESANIFFNEQVEGDITEASTLYHKKIDWKMFIPPLTEYEDYGIGWALISDLLLRLPLSLFLSLVSLPYEIPRLDEYMSHPIRKHFLVKNLPKEIAEQLKINRKYMYAIYETITQLSFTGLIQMGKHSMKEKDQVFVFLNKNALLFNTTSSEPGYNKITETLPYEYIHYNFNLMDDVEHYWYELRHFAINTKLGARNCMEGKPIVIESVTTKKILEEALQPKSCQEAYEYDIGYLPGDHLGAAGLDSDLFVHLKRNWDWPGEEAVDSPKFKESLNLKKKKIISHVKRPSQPAKNDDKVKLGKVSVVQQNRARKRTHKKVTRILKPKKSRYGRKPFYDQKDREALKKMVKLRVDWSSAEDNMLLICKVASLYLSRNKRSNLAKNFCAVREILHTQLPELSKNKTSRACQRRIHYMMKKPSTANSVYLCLEEIKQDAEINEYFSSALKALDRALVETGEGPRSYQDEYDKLYSSLVSKLIVKLKTIENKECTLENISIPNTIDEFNNSFNVQLPTNLGFLGAHAEVHSTISIMCCVVNSVIHSSLCCSMDKTSYSYQLFYVYQQYPDKLLRTVMAKCRSMSIMSCRKRYKKYKTGYGNSLPLSSSPYQLSITYVNMLQTPYQFQIFSESFRCMELILKEVDNQTLPLEDSIDPDNNLVPIQVSNGGACANIAELYSLENIEMFIEFPENFIVLDPKLSEKEETYKLIMKRFREVLSFIRGKNGTDKDQSDDDEEPEENTAGSSIKESMDEEYYFTSNKGVASAASRLAVIMLRDDPTEQLDKSLQHAHDYFVLKPCKLSIRVKKTKTAESIKLNKSEILADIKRMSCFPEERLNTCDIIENLKESFDKNVLSFLLNFLEEKRDLGATYGEIEDLLDCSDHIANLLQVLVDNRYVLRSGLVNIRYIHGKFAKHWLAKSYYIPKSCKAAVAHKSNVGTSYDLNETERESEPMEVDSSSRIIEARKKKKRWVKVVTEHKFDEVDTTTMEQVYVSMRPWIRIDGTLNRKILNRLIGSVLGHCMSNPGATMQSIKDRFTPALQPVHTRELIEILNRIECVTIKKLQKTGKSSLFSRQSVVTLEKYNGFGDPKCLIVEPDLLAVTKLGQFIGTQTTDYLEFLTDSKMTHSAVS